MTRRRNSQYLRVRSRRRLIGTGQPVCHEPTLIMRWRRASGISSTLALNVGVGEGVGVGVAVTVSETLGDGEAGALLAPALVGADAAASRPQPATSAQAASSAPANASLAVGRVLIPAPFLGTARVSLNAAREGALSAPLARQSSP